MTGTSLRTECLVILGYNAILLLQVFVFGFPVGNVLLAFWVENLLIGVVAFVSLVRAKRSGNFEGKEFIWRSKKAEVNLARHPSAWIVYYGMFCFGHLCFTGFLAVVTGLELSTAALLVPILFAVLRETTTAVQTALLNPESRRLADRRIVADAQTRMIVLHMTVLIGLIVFFVLHVWLQAPATIDYDSDGLLVPSSSVVSAGIICVLVVFKTIGEVYSLRRSQRMLVS